MQLLLWSFCFGGTKKEETRLKKRKMHQLKIQKKTHNHLPNYEAQLKEKGFINQIQRNQNVCFTSKQKYCL